MTAYYNEWEPYPAQWLRNLSDGNHIAPGHIDRRSITEVTPDELRQYTQCHFFAGIGVWSYALRLAGWPDDYPVWSASLPCQPWSAAGDGKGEEDERHLWPVFYRLVCECRPRIIVGEQVSSKDGLKWFDIVSADLERAGYAVTALDLCASSVGAPNVRQRLYWVAYATGERSGSRFQRRESPSRWWDKPLDSGSAGRMEHTDSDGRQGGVSRGTDTQREIIDGPARRYGPTFDPDAVRGFWSGADWIGCRDGKFRPIKPGLSPLANGFACRVGKLRAYGNSINAPLAAAFIESVIETLDELGVL